MQNKISQLFYWRLFLVLIFVNLYFKKILISTSSWYWHMVSFWHWHISQIITSCVILVKIFTICPFQAGFHGLQVFQILDVDPASISRQLVHIRWSLVKGVIQSPIRFFDTNPAGRILNRFSKDMGKPFTFDPNLIHINRSNGRASPRRSWRCDNIISSRARRDDNQLSRKLVQRVNCDSNNPCFYLVTSILFENGPRG